jgi:hypothetical protein
MRKKYLISLFGAGMAVVLSAGLATAKTNTVQFAYRTSLGNGTVLNPGSYRVVVINDSSTPKVAFYQGSKQVAETPVRLVPVSKKNSETQVIYDQSHKNSNVLTEIDLDGWNQNMVFHQTATR